MNLSNIQLFAEINDGLWLFSQKRVNHGCLALSFEKFSCNWSIIYSETQHSVTTPSGFGRDRATYFVENHLRFGIALSDLAENFL